MTCLQIWWRKSVGDQLKPWNNACLVSVVTEALCLHLLIFTRTATFLRVTDQCFLPRIAAQPAGQVATVAQANQVTKWNNLSTWFFLLCEITRLASALRGTEFTNAGKCLQCPLALWNSSAYFSLFGHMSNLFFFKCFMLTVMSYIIIMQCIRSIFFSSFLETLPLNFMVCI